MKLFIVITKEGSVHKISKRKTYTGKFKKLIIELVFCKKQLKIYPKELDLRGLKDKSQLQ